ncbi:class I SAM-dependent methyltransferase [Jiangella anatolica]|uniref:Class I SAM-dependent methyltransferase n=1 Tax=Jiangella anatolica TaxID=2670374 RepID=A0A2W2C4D3_9ACTN|nr:class I SAM-dependent methyltransferase [Jiangella anatolica]PZF83059.1 class I SAM-dependent methyltransferase [Jiangella anatolica]
MEIGDAFGRVLERCHAAGGRPGVAFTVMERDDGHIGVHDAAGYFTGLDDWPEAERRICAGLAGRVLDVGCGAGRHAAVLAAGGVDVVGVDPSPGAVAVARERGVDARLGSAEALPDGIGTFDAVLLLGNNVGLLGSATTAPVVLAELARVTAPGGRLLLSGLDPFDTDDAEHLAYHRWNRERGRLPGQCRLRVRDGALATEWFDYLFVSEPELRALVEPSPWTIGRWERDGHGYAVELTRGR